MTPDQRAILERVRAFNREVVAPVSERLDGASTPEAAFSWEIVEEADRVGIRTLTLETGYGGGGADSLTTAMVIEELARQDVGVSVMLAQTLKLVQTLQGAATPEQKDRLLPRFRDDPRALLAIGITEPETASDYIIPYRDPGKAFATTAARRAGGWALSGQKHFISNGNRAALYLIFAQTDSGRSLTQGATCFIVERDTPGFSIGVVHDKLGERLTNNAELVFQDCILPPESVLGQVGGGFELLRRFFVPSNAYAAASVLGVAQAAYEKALAWTRARVQGGAPLVERSTTREDLARMHMLIGAARAYLRHAAHLVDHPEGGWDPALGALPKVFASQVAWEVVTRAFELHGGYAFMREKGTGMEKLLRDAATFLHSDGANRALLLKAAGFIAPPDGAD